VKVSTYRLAFGIGLFGALLLFWVNSAVGIIGNEEQDANLLYGAVFVVGAVGAFISRFKPQGMATTLFVACVIQMCVPIFALFIWAPSAISWSPSVTGVFVISAFFTLLFLVSGYLFKVASRSDHYTIK
jgi:hypothetical protein